MSHEKKNDRLPQKEQQMNQEGTPEHLRASFFPLPMSKTTTLFRTFGQQQQQHFHYSQHLQNKRLLYPFHLQNATAANILPHLHLSNHPLDPRPNIRSLNYILNQGPDQDTWILEKLMYLTHKKTQMTHEIQIAQLTNTIECLKQVIKDKSQCKINARHDDLECEGCHKGKRSPIHSFPHKLHEILSDPEYSHCITWLPHGRAWKIIRRTHFERDVLPRHFRHGRYSSFLRQVSQ